jgi:hypothetical protein
MFGFRDEPADLDLFQPLRQIVAPRSRPRTEPAPPPPRPTRATQGAVFDQKEQPAGHSTRDGCSERLVGSLREVIECPDRLANVYFFAVLLLEQAIG